VHPSGPMRHAGSICTRIASEVQQSVDDFTTPATETWNATASGHREPAPPSLLERLMTISRASALEEMASGIAHELNQPLGAIVTFAQAGERILAFPDGCMVSAREVFQLITKEVLAAAEGIRNMRRLFSRDDFNKEPCDIGQVLRELTPVLELLAPSPAAELLVSIDAMLPLSNIDSLRIQHVLFTLVQNAFEAHAADSATAPSVGIEIHADRYGVEVAVMDRGCGITEQQRQQIFHPFFTTKSHGTGLGLASARAIIDGPWRRHRLRKPAGSGHTLLVQAAGMRP
jgi:C4-dicarboxylate-specific signal transduction histidine kinase